MADFVLVHGAWHGAWCWERVVPLLEAAGHTARAIDLPGHGRDRTPVAEVTLDAYRDRILEALGDRPAVLVGHSLGGVPVAAAAEAAPERVVALAFVAAFLLRSGERLVDRALNDAGSPIQDHVIVAADRSHVRFDPEWAGRVFYSDCSPADAARAAARLRPQATAIAKTRLTLTPERFGRLPRTYIICTEDRAVTPKLQRAMAKGWPDTATVEMASGHSPFISDPATLAGHLIAAAAGHAAAK